MNAKDAGASKVPDLPSARVTKLNSCSMTRHLCFGARPPKISPHNIRQILFQLCDKLVSNKSEIDNYAPNNNI